MLAYFLSTNVGPGYWTTILGVTALALSLGYVLYEALLVSLRGESFERSILLTLGLSMVLYGAVLIVAMLLFPGGLGGWLQRRRLTHWRRPPLVPP